MTARQHARTRRPAGPPLPPGFLNVRKPAGVTSHDVVDFLRQLTGDRRVGHCGTLDPRASGVLPLCIGSATRLADCLVAARKSYRATALLDRTTDTGDLDGLTLARYQLRDGGVAFGRHQLSAPPALEAVHAALAKFRGALRQEVPAYSAVRVGGERLYELARAGTEVERPVRDIEVERLELLRYEWPVLELDVTCSKGTYIRQLAVDIGAELGVGGALDALVRTAVGALTLADSRAPGELAGAWLRGELAACRVPWETALAGTPVVTLVDGAGAGRIRRGMPLVATGVAPVPASVGPALLLQQDGEPLALCEVQPSREGLALQPRKVFA